MAENTKTRPFRLKDKRIGADVGSGSYGPRQPSFEPPKIQEKRVGGENEKEALVRENERLKLLAENKRLREVLAGKKPKEPTETEQMARTRFRQQQGARRAKRLTQTGELEAELPKAPMGLLKRAGLGLETFTAEEVDPLHKTMEDFRTTERAKVAARQTQQNKFIAAKNKAVVDTEKRMNRDGWFQNETGAWVGPSGEPVSDQIYEQAYNRALERQQEQTLLEGGNEKTLRQAIEEQKAAQAEVQAEAEAAAQQAAGAAFDFAAPAGQLPAAPPPAPAEPPLTPEEIMEIQRLLGHPGVSAETKQELRQFLIEAGLQ